MFKKLIIGGLLAILVGAVAVGAYDLIQGDSALAYRDGNDAPGIGQPAAAGQGRGSGNGSSGLEGTGNRGVGQADNQGSGKPEPEATVDEWIAVSGVVESVDTSGLTVVTADGQELVVELGPPHFWSSQNVEIEPGDAVEVLGFYESDSFIAGDIWLTATGEHIMLRDPNGRPLWAGGPATSQGNKGETAAYPAAETGQGLADGNQAPQPQATVDEWISVQGVVTAVELNALIIETANGETMLVQLGPEHFWTAQGIAFEAGDHVKITGFFEDEVDFIAGEVMLLDTGEVLALRDTDGRPLWAGGPGQGGRGNGGGQDNR